MRAPAPDARRRRQAGLALLLAAASGLAACGASGTPSAGAPAARSTTTTTSAPPTTAPPDLSYLTAWGATLAQWNANHTIDPRRPNAYWPRLSDNRDTYTNLDVVGGRVVGYVLALYPAVTSKYAKFRISNDLPLDAVASQDRILPGCEEFVESSPTMVVASPGGALVQLTSAGPSYNPAAVSTVTVAPLARGQALPSACI